MAYFEPSDSRRTDWTLLSRGPVTLYLERETLEADLAWLADHGYEIHRFDCSEWTSDRDALRGLGNDLGFKDCLGRDRGEECVCDVEIPLDGGAAVVLFHYDQFVKVDSKAAEAILDVLALNSHHFMLFGQRLITLVESNEAKLTLGPVGSRPVRWRGQD